MLWEGTAVWVGVMVVEGMDVDVEGDSGVGRYMLF